MIGGTLHCSLLPQRPRWWYSPIPTPSFYVELVQYDQLISQLISYSSQAYLTFHKVQT